MNRLRGSLSSAVAAIVLIGVVGFVIVSYRPLAGEGLPANSLPAPASPTASGLLPASPTRLPGWQLPTPLPDPGIRLSVPRQVQLGAGIYVTTPVGEAALQDNVFVAVAEVPGGRTIVEIDLLTGQLRYLAPIDVPPPGPSPYAGDLRISGRYVVWVQHSGPRYELVQLHVLDRTTLRAVPPEGARYVRAAGDIELKDDLLLWKRGDPRPFMEFGYDLRTRREFTLTEAVDYGYIRLCSRDWFIYVPHVPTNHSETPLDLRAHNLNTGEDFQVGSVVYPDTLQRGRQHACDGENVVWISPGVAGGESGLEYRHFNLATRTMRVLPIPASPSYRASVGVSGDIVIAQAGYSLSRNVAFNLFASLPLEMNYGGPRVVSGETFAWISDYGLWEGRSPWRLYTASIVRDP